MDRIGRRRREGRERLRKGWLRAGARVGVFNSVLHLRMGEEMVAYVGEKR